MQQRPVIGIPMQTLQAIDGIPESLPMSWVMNQRYILTLTAVGAVPWMIPLLHDVGTLREVYERLDGVFIAGGVDMDPATYGEALSPLCGRIDRPRDQTELALTRWAMEDGKPALGVCRGLQVINVAAGGTLYQDLAAEYPGAIKHDYFPGAGGYARDFLAHEIRIEGQSRLHRSFGAERIRVNSMHHQGIKTLGEGLVPTAWAPDGVIEAAESVEHPFLAGAQWHPEMLADTDAPTLQLFTSFVDAAVAFHQGREVAGAVAA